jgi:predicted nucleic acid-binding protein
MRGKIRVFLDTSALFAGVWSPAGGARAVLRLAELGAIELWVSPLVLEELERALQRKAPESLPWLAMLLDRIDVQWVRSPAPEAVHASRRLIQHPGDAQIVASAWSAEVDYFVTLDRKHLLGNAALREAVPFAMGTPGDFLAWLRRQWQARSRPAAATHRREQ